MAKKTVFLTGSSGNMGHQGFIELYKKNKFNIVLLNRDSEKNHKIFKDYENDDSVKLVWGDLMNYDDVLSCVKGSDIVLHVGGMVSPAADYYPKKTIKTNTTAMKNIVEAVKAQPNKDDIKLVYIGTVAETGDRNEPIHWGRTGDPIKISYYDHYALSKVKAERIIAESGLKHWVSLRQTGILYAAILKNMDPIMYHVPLNGVLEWATVEDSGRLLANVCEDSVPEDFWRRFYNIGSGKDYRITNFEFEELLLKAIGLSSTKKLFNPNWFATTNFHGQWYTDSDILEDYLHFRANIPIQDYFDALAKKAPKYFKFAKIAPSSLIKKFLMKPITKTEIYGTMNWMENDNKERITAYFGSREKWEKLSDDWNKYDVHRPSDEMTYLDHGYDESKPTSELDIEDMKKAAKFRGGECLSEKMTKGDLFTPLKWKCAFGHEFEMTPNLVLKGGHWCHECLPYPWNYDEEAAKNPFFAQVWYPHHEKHEHNIFHESIFKGMDGYKD